MEADGTRARGDAAALVSRTPTRRTPASPRSSSATRARAAASTRAAKCATACSRSRGSAATNTCSIAPPLAESVARAKALGAGQSGRARAADRPLRQLRLGRRAGCDGRRRRNPAAGAGRRRDRADPRSRGGRDDDRRRRRPARQARARRPYRHAVDRPRRAAARASTAACAAITDGEFAITGPMYTGMRTLPRAHRGARHRARADRRHRAPARAVRPGRVHATRASTRGRSAT